MEHALPLTGGRLSQLLNSILGVFISAEQRVTPAERTNFDVISEYGRWATDEVLAATDLENLSDRLDALVGDDEFWQKEQRPSTVQENREALQAGLDSELNMSSLSRVLGITPARRFAQGWDALVRSFHKFQALMVHLDKMFPNSASNDPKQVLPSEWIYDLRIPVTLRQFFRLAFQNLATVYVVGRAEERGQKLEPWLALGLANAFAEGPERLIVLISDPDAVVKWAVSLLFDLGDLSRLDSTREWGRIAAASPDGAYRPFAESEGRVDE